MSLELIVETVNKIDNISCDIIDCEDYEDGNYLIKIRFLFKMRGNYGSGHHTFIGNKTSIYEQITDFLNKEKSFEILR